MPKITIDDSPQLQRGTASTGIRRLSYKDALEALPELRTLCHPDTAVPDRASLQHVVKLIEVTIKWENCERSWAKAELNAEQLGRSRKQLRDDVKELICAFVVIMVRCLETEPVLAANAIALCCDDNQDLYSNKFSSYASGYYGVSLGGKDNSYYDNLNEEGATFLKGTAPTKFAQAGGYEALTAILQKANVGVAGIKSIVDLLFQFKNFRSEIVGESFQNCCQAVATAVQQFPEATFIEEGKTIFGLLRLLFEAAETPGSSRKKAKAACRVEVENAWKQAVATGLRSTNLQARRNAVAAMARSQKNGLSGADIAPWLQSERLLVELFGDRFDERVLDDLDLNSLCVPTATGFRALLTEMEPGLRSDSCKLLAEKLHRFAITKDTDMGITVWGRDLIVKEIMKWSRDLIRDGRSGAVSFVAHFVSTTAEFSVQSGEGGRTSNEKKALFHHYISHNDEMFLEALEAVLESMVADEVDPVTMARLEQAFFNAIDMATCVQAPQRWCIDHFPIVLARIVDEIGVAIGKAANTAAGPALHAARATGSGTVPMKAASFRILLRIMQSYPYTSEHNRRIPSREEGMKSYQGLPDFLFAELERFVTTGSDPLSYEDVQWRLRALCFAHRCFDKGAMNAERFMNIATLLRPVDNGAHLCHFLRILIASAGGVRTQNSMPNEVKALPAFSEEILPCALQFLEDWAAEAGGLSLPAFFCLQQLVVILNCRSGEVTLLGKNGNQLSAEAFAADGVQAETSETPVKPGSAKDCLGKWILLEKEGVLKCGQIVRFDATTNNDFIVVDFIDESKLKWLPGVVKHWVPPLLEQEPAIVKVESFGDPNQLKGLTGLWGCALGDGSSQLVAQRSADLLLALHQGETGMRMLMSRLFQELRVDAAPNAVGKGLALLDILFKRLPLTRPRSHLGSGFPIQLSITEVYYESHVDSALGSRYVDVGKKNDVLNVQQVRRTIDKIISADSQTTLCTLHKRVATAFERRYMRLKIPDETRLLDPRSQQTLQEAGLAIAGIKLEAEATNADVAPSRESAVDKLGSEECDRLLQILARRNDLKSSDRELCWQLVLGLPTHAPLLASVKEPTGSEWPTLLSNDRPWHSIYVTMIIDTITSSLRKRPQAGLSLARAISEDFTGQAADGGGDAAGQIDDVGEWLGSFVDAGGFNALIAFFINFTEACEGKSDEDPGNAFNALAAALPPLVRTVGACALGRVSAPPLDADTGVSVVNAAIVSTRWLFEKSKSQSTEGPSWQRVRLRHASADCLELLTGVQRITELRMEIVDGKVLPLLLDLAKHVEGRINVRVAGAIVQTTRCPGVLPLLVKQLVDLMPAVASSSAPSPVPFFEIVFAVVSNLGGQSLTLSAHQRGELANAAAQAVTRSTCNIAALYRLLAALLEGEGSWMSAAGSPSLGPDVGEIAPRVIDRLCDCIIPELDLAVDEDDVREHAVAALFRVLGGSDTSMLNHVLRKAAAYLTQTPTPEPWDFEPKAPKSPSTAEDARRNDSGYTGLVNRGMTCYMNSTLQQLFWSSPFRNSILASPPPVPDASERPAPLPDSTTGLKKKEREQTFKDVGFQVQRAFAYLQDCELGQFNTDDLVKSCGCLRLEYEVTQQNDASELFDKMLDAIDKTYAPPGASESQMPSWVFAAKTVRQKTCLQCNFRSRNEGSLTLRTQLNELQPTLEECLAKVTEPETMMGDNKVDCDRCKERRDTKFETFFTQLPQILVLHLARIQFDLETFQRVKKNPRIVFGTKLDMSKYTEDGVMNGTTRVPGCSYELQGSLVHTGGADSGHYYSFAQDSSGKWFKFNDDRVSAFSVDDLDAECYGGQENTKFGKRDKSHNAIILFYRCVDAAPYRARPASPSHVRPPSSAGENLEKGPALLRSVSERSAANAGVGMPPVLSRTATSALAGEQLEERQRKRRQMMLKSSLAEEIERINARLHRQAVIYSGPGNSFLSKLVDGNLEPEAQCRISSKIIFDVALHGKMYDSKKLQSWVTFLSRQLQQQHAADWLLRRLSGETDEILGKQASNWVPKLLCSGLPHGDRFLSVVSAVVAAANTASPGTLAIFLDALFDFMPEVNGVAPVARYGELLAQLIEASPTLCTQIVSHRYHQDQSLPLTALLLHLYMGRNSTLAAPPAPRVDEARLSNAKGYLPLLRAVNALFETEPSLAAHPMVQDVLFWKTLIGQSPEVFVADCALRRLLPQTLEVQRQVSIAVIDALYPIGAEDLPRSRTLRIALTYLISIGGGEQTDGKLRELCGFVSKLHGDCMDAYRKNSRITVIGGIIGGLGADKNDISPSARGETNTECHGLTDKALYSSVPYTDTTVADKWGLWNMDKKKTGGPKNPDALQLLRVLQAVGALQRDLPAEWSFARDWLAEISSRWDASSWEKQGVPIAEVRILMQQLRGPGGEALSSHEDDTDNEVLVVSGAGTPFVNGVYEYAGDGDDACSWYQNLDDEEVFLRQQKNAWDECRWLIITEAKGTRKVNLYYFSLFYSKDRYPPTNPQDWKATANGDEPLPSIKVKRQN